MASVTRQALLAQAENATNLLEGLARGGPVERKVVAESSLAPLFLPIETLRRLDTDDNEGVRKAAKANAGIQHVLRLDVPYESLTQLLQSHRLDRAIDSCVDEPAMSKA